MSENNTDIESYKRGEHPKSLSNLQHDGRPMRHGAKKRRRNVSATDWAWEQLPERVDAAGCPSVSELLEQIALDRVLLVRLSDEAIAAITTLPSLAERQTYLAHAIETALRSDGLLKKRRRPQR